MRKNRFILISLLSLFALSGCKDNKVNSASNVSNSTDEMISLSSDDGINYKKESLKFDDIDLIVGQTVKLVPKFSRPEVVEDITYTTRSTYIALNGDEVTGLIGNKLVKVLAKSEHFSTVININTSNENGLLISDVNSWISEEEMPIADIVPLFEDESKKEELNYEYDEEGFTITNDNKVLPKKTGAYKVLATSKHYGVEFSVNITNIRKDTTEWDSSKFISRANTLKSRYQNDGIDGVTTAFIGSSYFDERWFWTDYNTNSYYINRNIQAYGISEATTYDWENLHDTIFHNASPKNFAIGIGSNNIFDDKDSAITTISSLERLFYVLRDNYPSTNLYWFSMVKRAGGSYSTVIDMVNDAIKKFCDSRDWITYVEIGKLFDTSMLRDGVHPKLEYYKLFVDELEKAGCQFTMAE